ncbi:MAG: tyrosine--tRNA ligase [Nitrospiria bacterium]
MDQNLSEIENAAALLARGTEEVVPRDGLLAKLKKASDEKRPLRVKVGIDPTAPRLHFGHLVLLQKMRQFQDLGHEILFLIGDFTGMIGDPTGRSEIRKPLTREDVLKNAETYKEQVFKIIDPERTTIRFNSEWMDLMTAEKMVQLTSHYTVARLLERDDFQKRYQSAQPIGVHEFLYPLIQGYDSVALKADIELGGTDQKFNLLVGRVLQKVYAQSRQVVITLPLLEGTDGKRKMSKSFGNDIAFEDIPFEMFGKIMSVRDELMYRYYELLTDQNLEEIRALHPMEAKLRLAFFLVADFHGRENAQVARDQFDNTVGRQTDADIPSEIVEDEGPIAIVDLIFNKGWAKSKRAARQLILQGAVELNRSKVTDFNQKIVIKDGDRQEIKVGKKNRYYLVKKGLTFNS